MKKFLISFFLLPTVHCLLPTPTHAEEVTVSSRAVVVLPVADIRRSSQPYLGLQEDPLQETQALFGDSLKVLEQQGSWFRVEVPDQAEYTHEDRWQGYPGWIQSEAVMLDEKMPAPDVVVRTRWGDVLSEPDEQADALLRIPFGSRLPMRSQYDDWIEVLLPQGQKGWMHRPELFFLKTRVTSQRRRDEILENAEQLIGERYFWGGLSPSDAENTGHTWGVDCSGLTYLCYRAAGVIIPRDAHEQWMKAQRIRRKNLRPGDLIFVSAEKNPKKITHVMLYAGRDEVIEGAATGTDIHRTLLKSKNLQGRTVYYGRFLND